MRRRRARALRRRYGRSFMRPHAISRPVGRGMYRVIVVDPEGDELQQLANRVPYSIARDIIKRYG